MTNKYFEKMYEVNPQNWTVEAAIVIETYPTEDGSYESETVRYFGEMDIDEALSVYTGNCQHCNKRHKHFVVMSNNQNGDMISIGWQCYDETFSHATQVELDLHRAKKQAEAAVRRMQIRKAAMAYQADHSELFSHLEANSNWNRFYADMLMAIARYGSLTEGQEAACYRSMKKDKARDEAKADEAPAKPAPEGKGIVVEGTVVRTKVQHGYYGDTLKMTVKTEDGWRVYCTVPETWVDENDAYKKANWAEQDYSHMGGFVNSWHIDEGTKVRFTVNLEQAADDETMAWGKRPRKAEVLS